MKILNINNTSDIDLSNYIVNEDVTINLILKLDNVSLDFPINITHKTPNLTSIINIKAALNNKSTINIPTQIHINKGAINTSTQFKALIYLLSPNARASITPALYIEEKNIKIASHGVVIKNIKDKDISYFLARGISKEKAKEFITSFK